MNNRCSILFSVLLLLTGTACDRQAHTAPSVDTELRIVAIAPSTAEILYAIGLSNEVVGVSRFCEWPSEAAAKPSVGGAYDPNWEMIVALQPDLVVGLDSQEEIAAQLQQLGIDFLGVAHERVDEIIQSIRTIGEACGAGAEAHQLSQTLQQQISRRPEQRTSPRPRVLVCVGHDEMLTRMYVAAKNTFYDDLIELAGGENACPESAIKYPEISPESLRAMNPDIIIDILPNPGPFRAADWAPYRAAVMTNSYAAVPGPRFPQLLEDLIGAIHE